MIRKIEKDEYDERYTAMNYSARELLCFGSACCGVVLLIEQVRFD